MRYIVRTYTQDDSVFLFGVLQVSQTLKDTITAAVRLLERTPFDEVSRPWPFPDTITIKDSEHPDLIDRVYGGEAVPWGDKELPGDYEDRRLRGTSLHIDDQGYFYFSAHEKDSPFEIETPMLHLKFLEED